MGLDDGDGIGDVDGNGGTGDDIGDGDGKALALSVFVFNAALNPSTSPWLYPLVHAAWVARVRHIPVREISGWQQ